MCCGGECVLNDYAGIYPADNDQWDFTQDQFHIDISIESCLEGEGCYHNDSGGYNSIFIHQDANEPYPGICNQDNCMGGSDPRVGVWPESYAYGTNSGSTSWRCIWETDGPWVTGGPSNRCFFADDPSTIPACKFSSKGTPDACDAYEGEGFPWPVTNRVMWGKAVCDTSGFGLEPGKEYIFSFYYKGNISGDYNSAMIQMAYNLGWSSQSRSCQECQNNGSCNPSCPIDFNDPDDPCGKCRFVNYPYQTAPYPHIDLGSIPSGNYPDWQRYVTSFTYTDEMNRLFDSNGNLHHEMGFTMPYRNIGDGGTNLYIDDVQFKSCPVLP
ncbi:hypothetical protein B6D52_02375 [Candidatus Parcubacteria bacterium 4484_255]|nr:MAG: hypothetical protein B6D52_02375 [Candidatus Parcubacteria bacterium 4484_255]